MNIINNLVLGVKESEQKFVVIVLSNGDVHFCTMPLYSKGLENRHKDIVAKFCADSGFRPTYVNPGGVIETAKKGSVSLEIDGGGLVRHRPDSKSVSSSISSSDYGRPLRSVVEHCLREAMSREGLVDGYEVHIHEVREK